MLMGRRQAYRAVVERRALTAVRGLNPRIVDVLLAVALFVVFSGGVTLDQSAPRPVPPAGGPPGPVQQDAPAAISLDWFAFVLIGAAFAALAWRRRAPLATLGIVVAATATYVLRGYPAGYAIALPLVVAVYTVAAHRDRREAGVVAVPLAVATALTFRRSMPDTGWLEAFVVVVFLVGLPILFGRIAFNRRRRLGQDLERAAHDAVLAERTRIAHELHDVVAHAMGVMVVQAGAARMVLTRDPHGATDALRRIEDTGRSGLAEMRRLLGVLETGDRDEAAWVPQPGLDHLDDLLASMRGTGLRVDLTVEGTPRPLPPGVDLTAYRLVQEALTNALKHAGHAHARVLLRFGPEALEVQVTDDGLGPKPGGARPAGGRGLIGMRERMAVFGGSLQTGERPGGGFLVHATIPLAGAS
jgi:signal transduction histidine kinase